MPSVFRDSHGVVHTVSSADPLLDLPGLAASALADALLRPDEADLDDALERCEAVRELVDRWQDAFFSQLPAEVDLAEEARWAAEAGLSLQDIEAGYDGDDPDGDLDDDLHSDLDDDLHGDLDGDLDGDLAVLGDLGDAGGPATPAHAHVDPVAAVLPEELVSVLERELLLLPLRVRLEALVAAGDLVATWVDLLADHEKLLGHLVLAHDEPASRDGHERLAARHAGHHGRHGPGHDDASDEDSTVEQDARE